MDRLPEAVAECSTAIRLGLNSADVYFDRGSVYSKLAKYTEAIHDFTESIRLGYPIRLAYTDSMVYELRASAHSKLRQYDSAIRDLTEAIRRDHIDPSKEYYDRGEAYAALRQYAEAISNYSEVIRLRTPRMPDVPIPQPGENQVHREPVRPLLLTNRSLIFKHLRRFAEKR